MVLPDEVNLDLSSKLDAATKGATGAVPIGIEETRLPFSEKFKCLLSLPDEQVASAGEAALVMLLSPIFQSGASVMARTIVSSMSASR